MNYWINQLYKIASKPELVILGLMSGTSVDGLDMALCRISGSGTDTQVTLEKYKTGEYKNSFQEEIATIFSKEQISLQKLTLLNEWVATEHARMINETLAEWGLSKGDVDIIASHGQTIYHAPRALHKQEKFGNATLQIGDGDHLAVHTGIITLSDFRQKHIAAGGEGAPLAVYGDYLIFSKPGENRVMLNIGGIANFTNLPADGQMHKVFSTDTGPGNTIMDAYMKKYLQQNCDTNAALALQGTINLQLLNALKQNEFFLQPLPKTTGPELFNLAYLTEAQAKSDTKGLSHEDVLATLNRFSAETIAEAILKTNSECNEIAIFSSGGGMHNPLLMKHLKHLIPNATFKTTEVLNIHPDAKEGVLFAVLANECLKGNAPETDENAANMPWVAMGKISLPG